MDSFIPWHTCEEHPPITQSSALAHDAFVDHPQKLSGTAHASGEGDGVGVGLASRVVVVDEVVVVANVVGGICRVVVVVSSGGCTHPESAIASNPIMSARVCIVFSFPSKKNGGGVLPPILCGKVCASLAWGSGGRAA